MTGHRPHVLGIDDGPFDKRRDERVSIVGVMMEGADLVEAVAVTAFAVDGDDAAGFLAGWLTELRFAAALHAIVLGGMTIAGLGIVDVELLSRRSGVPVLTVNRREPEDEPLKRALVAAGLEDRLAVLAKAPPSWCLGEGDLWVAHAGASREDVARILNAVRLKSQLPEPLRLAHLIGAAIVSGQSRGRP